MSLNVTIQKSLKSLNLDINLETNGESTGILGASGCGKSLTLKCIAGIETPDSGKIILNDRVLYDSEKGINLKPQQRKVGLLFQSYALFPKMTVRENIEIAVAERSQKAALAQKMMNMLRITHLQNSYPYQISGGEQQRVALARMMAYEPELMMFDEPFSALDLFLKDQLQQEILEVLKEYHGEILMVSHSREELYRFCDYITVISQGKTIEKGRKEEVFRHPVDITTAKLTGCKNISRARKRSDYELDALDWKVRLNTSQYVEDDICYVGIRAHNLQACHGAEEVNSVPIVMSGFSEGPFENSIIVQPALEEASRLWWIISKQEWKTSLKERVPKRLTLPKEHLLLLKDIRHQ